MASSKQVVLTVGSRANAVDILALLKSWRDVSARAQGELLSDLVAKGLLSAADASDVAAKTGARL